MGGQRSVLVESITWRRPGIARAVCSTPAPPCGTAKCRASGKRRGPTCWPGPGWRRRTCAAHRRRPGGEIQARPSATNSAKAPPLPSALRSSLGSARHCAAAPHAALTVTYPNPCEPCPRRHAITFNLAYGNAEQVPRGAISIALCLRFRRCRTDGVELSDAEHVAAAHRRAAGLLVPGGLWLSGRGVADRVALRRADPHQYQEDLADSPTGARDRACQVRHAGVAMPAGAPDAAQRDGRPSAVAQGRHGDMATWRPKCFIWNQAACA